ANETAFVCHFNQFTLQHTFHDLEEVLAEFGAGDLHDQSISHKRTSCTVVMYACGTHVSTGSPTGSESAGGSARLPHLTAEGLGSRPLRLARVVEPLPEFPGSNAPVDRRAARSIFPLTFC